MTGPALFQTPMGKRFYEHTMPELVRQISRLNDVLERLLEAQPPGRPTTRPAGEGEEPARRDGGHP